MDMSRSRSQSFLDSPALGAQPSSPGRSPSRAGRYYRAKKHHIPSMLMSTLFFGKSGGGVLAPSGRMSNDFDISRVPTGHDYRMAEEHRVRHGAYQSKLKARARRHTEQIFAAADREYVMRDRDQPNVSFRFNRPDEPPPGTEHSRHSRSSSVASLRSPGKSSLTATRSIPTVSLLQSASTSPAPPSRGMSPTHSSFGIGNHLGRGTIRAAAQLPFGKYA